MIGPVSIQAWNAGAWVKLVVIDALSRHRATEASHEPATGNGWLIVLIVSALLVAVLWLSRRRR